ncbi:MAG: polysaccharide biosynthesis tyrosine autokinase [Flammeovirgaceae bacterium]|nr:polysaccharide biosynthesis tyrosine autokinase [Flammeovirgaceae bacterium]
MIVGIGFVFGVILNVFLIGLLYLVNDKIISLTEIERAISIPVLGSIPSSGVESRTLFHIVDHPRSMVSESIRSLRTNLDFFTSGMDRKVIVVSSTVSGEGKSFLAMNLGGVLSLSNKKVMLIDLDMRKAKDISNFKNNDRSKGISTILIRKNKWTECVSPTGLANFDFISSGPTPPNPAELLMSPEFEQLLNDLKSNYDFVVIDTPPIGLVADGLMAVRLADLSIYIFRANYSQRDYLNSLQRLIEINKLKNIAIVLNAIPASSKAYGYGYYEDKEMQKSLWRKILRV